MIDWIIDPVNLQEVRLISCGSKLQPINYMSGLCSMAWPHPEIIYGSTVSHFISITQAWFQGPIINNKDKSIIWEILRA